MVTVDCLDDGADDGKIITLYITGRNHVQYIPTHF